MSNLGGTMEREDVEILESCIGKVDSFCKEIGVLSKKTPNDAVNKFKLKFINNTIKEANDILGDELKPFKDFSFFEDEAMPSNSDVVFILAQYAEALDLYRSKHIHMGRNGWVYNIDDGEGEIRTNPPSTVRNKG